MAPTEDSKAFMGVGWGFPPAFEDRDRSLQMVSAEQDIRESLKILFATTPGERVMHPDYGCRLKEMVFEPLDDALLAEIKYVIQQAILFHEPRIILDPVEVEVQDYRNGEVLIRLNYRIRGTNTRSNMVYPFYLREGTSLPQFQGEGSN